MFRYILNETTVAVQHTSSETLSLVQVDALDDSKRNTVYVTVAELEALLAAYANC
jgi:hypothetical protein